MANSRSLIECVVNVDCLCVSMWCSASIGYTSWQLFEAEPLLRDVFASCEEQLGEKHPRSTANPDHNSFLEIRWFCPLRIITIFCKKMLFCAWKNHKNVNHNLLYLMLIFDVQKWRHLCIAPTTRFACAFCRSLNAMHFLAKAVMKTSASEAEILESKQSSEAIFPKLCLFSIVIFKIKKFPNNLSNLGIMIIMMCLCSVGLFVLPSCFFCLIELRRPRRSSVKELAMPGSWVWPNKHLPLCKI